MTDADSTKPDPESNSPGAWIGGRFELLEELGSGASGTVYRARTRVELPDLPAGSVVAIKFLRTDRIGDRQAREQLAQEGALGLRVQSPYVVRIYAVETIELLGMPISYLVMEWVEGRSLRGFLQETGPVLDALVRRVGRDAALALADLHRLGIVHRDVKPENLLFTSEARLKLMDLGLARGEREPGLGSSPGFFGSIAYAAPELLKGRPATPASDLYALGVVLYEMLTGEHPFARNQDADELLHAQLFSTPPPPSHLHPGVMPLLDRVVMELLAKEPRGRIASAAELAGILAEGESSRYWQRHERAYPELAARRRLDSLRRPAHTLFVDRRDERRRLDRLFRDMLRGRGGSVEVLGPSGIGRRRLLDECLDEWIEDERGLAFLGGIGENQPTTPPGTPLGQALREWILRAETGRAPRERERIAAIVENLWGWGADESGQLADVLTGGEQVRKPSSRADLIARGVLHLAEDHRGTVVRIDHFERLGTTARLAVEQLARAAKDHRLLLLAVGTPELAGARVFDHSLTVSGLGRSDFVALGRALFEDDSARNRLFERAHPLFHGSPGDLLESLAELAQAEQLQGRPGSYRGLRGGADLRPTRPTVTRFRQQVASLPPSLRHLLFSAAALGRRFGLDDLSALSGRPELEVLEALGRFGEHFVQEGQGSARFRHPDYRLALLAEMPPGQRRSYHRMTAWLLEDRGAPPLEVGMQLSQAGEDQACLEPLLSGLEDLRSRGSRTRALRVARRLRLHLNRLPRDRHNLELRLRYLLLSGETHSLCEQLEGAARRFRKALLIARHLGDDHAAARAQLGLAELSEGEGRLMTAMGLLQQVIANLDRHDDQTARRTAAHARMLLSRVLAHQGQGKEAMACAAEALDRIADDPSELRGHLLVDLARWKMLRLHLGAAGRNLEDASFVFERVGDLPGRLRHGLYSARHAAWMGETERALELCAETEVQARRLGNVRILGRILLLRGEMAALGGDPAEAVRLLHDARDAAQPASDRSTQDLCTALLLLVDDSADENALAAEIDWDLQIPSVLVTWKLAQARRRPRAEAEAILAEAAAIERQVDLPLPLRLALRRADGREALAARMGQAIASRLPGYVQRRRFLQWANAVRIPT